MKLADWAREELRRNGIATLGGAGSSDAAASPSPSFDASKLVVCLGGAVSPPSLPPQSSSSSSSSSTAVVADGLAVERRLLAQGVAVEHADKFLVVPVLTLFDTEESVGRLVAAIVAAVFPHPESDGEAVLEELDHRGEHDETLDDEDEDKDEEVFKGDEVGDEEGDEAVAALLWSLGAAPVRRSRGVSLREAFFAASEAVPAADAPGRVSAETICPYPPGVPVLAPGEVVTSRLVDGLRAAAARGLRIAYASDPTLRTFRVLREEEEGEGD